MTHRAGTATESMGCGRAKRKSSDVPHQQQVLDREGRHAAVPAPSWCASRTKVQCRSAAAGLLVPDRSKSARKVWEEVRQQPKSARDWALQHSFEPTLVYSVLSGNRKCLRGKSHEVAKALKKVEPVTVAPITGSSPPEVVQQESTAIAYPRLGCGATLSLPNFAKRNFWPAGRAAPQ